MTKTIRLTIVFGRTHRPDIAIEDFWRQAQAAMSGSDYSLRCLAIYATGSDQATELSHEELELARVLVSDGGRVNALLSNWTNRQGPLGVLARLGKHNLASRRVARAVAADKTITEIVSKSNLVVAADPEADRAIWNLRRSTSAHLLHGPFAMSNALAELSQG